LKLLGLSAIPILLEPPQHRRVVRVFDLEPVARSAGLVARAAALRHDALEAELASVLEYDVSGTVEMHAQLEAVLRRCEVFARDPDEAVVVAS
jgi:hypothetical protein